MSAQTPYAQLTGTLTMYAAPAGEAIPDLDAAVAGNWTELGKTDGDQQINWIGTLTEFSNNDATGPIKHIRPAEGLNIVMQLVDLTLENMAQAMSMASSTVTTTTSGLLAVKELPLRRGFIPERSAILLRGGAVAPSNDWSAYGLWPAQLWIPQGVFEGEPSQVYGKGNRPEVAFTFKAEYDTTQSAGREFGYLQMQSS